MTAPRVSVVIPTYNSGPLAVEAVESVLEQTRTADEVIVVDDGSTDDTADRLARFAYPVRYIRKDNGGVSSARNRGVAEATGNLIAFLDADDVWHPRKLEFQLATVADRPDVGLIASRSYLWPADAHPPVGSSGVSRPAILSLDQLLARNFVITSTVLARADVVQAAGGFDPSLQGPEDYDLWLRIARRTTIAVLPDRLVGYRSATPNSLSKNAVRMESGLMAILGKLEAEGVFRRRPLLRRKAWAYVRYNCGLMYRDAGQLATAADRFVRSLACCPVGLNDGPGGRMPDRLRMLAVTVRRMLNGGGPTGSAS